MRRALNLLPFAAALLLALPAQAHKPSYSDGSYNAPDSAFEVEDIDVSIVLYHEVTCDAEQLWLAYDAPQNAELFVQLGVPVIDRLSDYRPSIAVLGPGLPEPDGELPFEVPEGLGVLVFDTDAVTEPMDFYEPFTQTESWILFEESILMPGGSGYIVAWHPARQTGKLWVAVGTVEQFGPDDWANASSWTENTQRFHEVGEYAPRRPVTEQTCGLESEEEIATGCSQSRGSATAGAALLLFALLPAARRRIPSRHDPFGHAHRRSRGSAPS